MKTRLFVGLFCLVWALGCGNRNPDNVDTGFSKVEAATLRFCNNSNCVGGANAGASCVDDTDCDTGTCEIFVALKECFGGSANPMTPCQTALDCGKACDAGPRMGKACSDDSGCKTCVGTGATTQCTTAADCGGTCLGGTISPDGNPCFTALECGGVCTGGLNPGTLCRSNAACVPPGVGVCSVDGDECVPRGTCAQTGSCVSGTCNQVGEGCVNAQTLVDFTGTWDSCLALDSFLKGTTKAPTTGRQDGLPVEVDVSGCNSATLDVDFTRAGAPTTPEAGCVSIDFTTKDRPSLEQCGQTVQMTIDF